MNDYLAAFFTHYGAMRFYKDCQKKGIPAKMQPVPRNISASCGTCVCFQAHVPPVLAEHEDMERCYAIISKSVYKEIKEI